MMSDDIVFAELRVEQDQAALTRLFAGCKDDLGMGHKVPAAIRTKKIVCFHGW
jgi:hypothetical protein